MTRELSTLLGAGIGLVEALEVLTKQHRGSFQSSLQLLRDEVAAGSSLAEAMRNQPHIFDELTVQMVEVGENSGTVDRLLAAMEKVGPAAGRMGGGWELAAGRERR